MRKFLARNRAAVGVVIVCAMLIVALSITALVQSARIAHLDQAAAAERASAAASRQREAALLEFLRDFLAAPSGAHCDNLAALEIFKRDAARICHDLREQPALYAKYFEELSHSRRSGKTGGDSRSHEESQMEARAAIQGYFAALDRGEGWQAWLADDVEFTSFASPVKHLNGKGAYLRATQRFYGSVRKAELRQLLIDGDRACALTRYELQPANGAPAFTSDIAESFVVSAGKIKSFEIYFDSAPFPK